VLPHQPNQVAAAEELHATPPGDLSLGHPQPLPQPEAAEPLGQLPAGTCSNYDVLRALSGVNDYYHREGYFMVDFKSQGVKNGVLVVEIREGKIAKIVVQGQPRTSVKVIRRVMKLKEGEFLTEARFTAARQALMALGYFRDVTLTPKWEDQGLVVEVAVKELEKLGKIGGSMAFSPKEGLVGNIEYSQKNLFGKAQDVSLSFSRGIAKGGTTWKLEYQGHAFPIYDLVSLDLYRKENPQKDKSKVTLGGKFNVAYPVGLYLDLKLGFTSEASYYQPSGEKLPPRTAVNLGLDYDSRDNPFFSRTGVNWHLSLEKAGTFAPGVEYLSLSADVARFWPVDIYTTSGTMDQGSIPATTFHWVMEDIPALKEEPYMPDPDNYYSRLEFEIVSIRIPGQGNHDFLTTWDKLDDELKGSEFFLPVIKEWGFLKDSVAVLMEGKDDAAVIQAVHDFIGRHVKWNNRERILASGHPKKIYKNGTGNSADINLMYAGLLRLAGFVTAPVIISTRDHGIVRDYNSPVISFYNYTMAVADKNGKRVLLDATEPLLPATMIPANCLNGKGRALYENGSKWIELKVPIGFNETIYCKMKIEDTGMLSGTVSTGMRGYKALLIRKYIKANGEEKYIETQKKDKSQWSFSDYQITGTEDAVHPLTEKYTCTIEGHVEEMGDLLILNPLINPELTENPFKAGERTFPIDFLAPRVRRNILVYTLPEGYTVDELPAGMIISTPDKNLVYTYAARKTTKNTLQIMSSLVIKKSLFPSSDYQTIKKFFDELFGKQNEQIILKKTM